MKQLICLIVPPSGFLADERVFPSLGIAKVAAMIRQEYNIDFLDLSGIKNYEDTIIYYLNSNRPNYIGITCTTPQFPYVKHLVNIMRSMCDTRIILGGPHVTGIVASYRQNKNGRIDGHYQALLDVCNVAVAGDGELSIFRALQDGAPQVIDGDNLESQFFLQRGTLEGYPFPARSLFDLHSYRYAIDGIPSTSLINQLGCPYACTFCGLRNSPSFRTIRTRSSEHVIAEMEQIYHTYGIRGFFFLDDEANISPNFLNHLKNIIRLQERLGIEFRFRAFIKSNLFTNEQAHMMYEAGFRNILVGFESGSKRILENIQKKATVEQNTRCVEIARRHNLKTKFLMSIGHAGESPETIRETEEWLLRMHPDDLDCTIISVYPATPYYILSTFSEKHQAWAYQAPNGDMLYADDIDFSSDESYYKGIPGTYTSHVFTETLSREDVVLLRDELEKTIRTKMNIPFYAVSPSIQYESSMGQLPGYVYRRIRGTPDVVV